VLTYILRRLLTLVPVLWAAATLTFLAIHFAPGDPATAQLAQSGASAAAIAERRAAMGLDDPLESQYFRHLQNLLRGDLGRSWQGNRAVNQVIGTALPPTFTLTMVATGLALLIGVTLGLVAALARHHARHTWLDAACMILALSGMSTPVAFSGLVAVLIFSLTLGWFPATGQGEIRHLLLPVLVLGWASAGSLARLTRSRLAARSGSRSSGSSSPNVSPRTAIGMR